MIDFGKLYCDLHPSEIITNFCLKETCMVGLCATCICTHTEYHVNNKTSPEYQNIRTTFSSIHQLIRSKINSLQTQKNRIEKITQFIQTKRKALRQNIEQTRQQAIAVVNNFFDKKQKTMLREMQSEEKKMGLHSQQRMQSLLNSLVRETSSLLVSAQELNSQNFLQSYQRIRTQTVVNAARLQSEISAELDRNEGFETVINTNDEYISGLMRVLQQSLYLSFKVNTKGPKTINEQSYVSAMNGPLPVYEQKTLGHKFSTELPSSQQSAYSKQTFLQNSSPQKNSNVFTALSFSNMPEMARQQTAKFNPGENDSCTTKSITLPESEKPSRPHSKRHEKTFISELSQSRTVNVNGGQNELFREKDTNERQMHHSLMKSSTFMTRNHQSQIITNEKPFGYQTSPTTGWYNPRQNNLYPQQGLTNQSLGEHLQHYSQEKSSGRGGNMLLMGKNRSTANLHQIGPQSQVNFSTGPKVNFAPQMFDPSKFNMSNQNQQVLMDCKKVKKSGLTLLKTNQSTLRDEIQPQ